MKRIYRLAPLVLLVFLLGCLSKEARNALEIVLASSSGFLKNFDTTAAEKGQKAADGTVIIPDGPTKIKNHIRSMEGLLANLDKLASSVASATATQNLVDNPASATTYDEHVSETVSWVKEIHVLCANYVKNDLPTSDVAGDKDFLERLHSALTGLSNDVLGETKTQAILNAITPSTTPTTPSTTSTISPGTVTATVTAAQGALPATKSIDEKEKQK